MGRLADGTSFFGRLGQVAHDLVDDTVQCHLCGRWLNVVGGTHIRWHGWTLVRYREAFQLRESVPTCSESISGQLRRSATARIGPNGFAVPPAAADRSIKSTPVWRSFATLAPWLVVELHPHRNKDVDPHQLAAGSKRKLWWLRPRCGHAWQAIIDNRVARGTRCPVSAIERRADRQSRVAPDRSLAVRRPDLARELHDTRNGNLDSDTLAVFSARKVWWRCSVCACEWQATPANRSRGRTGCPACWSRRRGQAARAVPFERSLAAKHPNLVAELDRTKQPEHRPISARSEIRPEALVVLPILRPSMASPGRRSQHRNGMPRLRTLLAQDHDRGSSCWI
jgi:Probable Zinc-ribbon domain